MLLNRAQIVRTIAACDALAAELRNALKADAAAEYAEQGTAPTWRMPGFTVSTSITHDAIEVVDERAWRAYVKQAYPTEIETVIRVRPAWQNVFFAGVAQRGDPPCDVEGTVIPGLVFVAGGDFKSVSVLPLAGTKANLRAVAQEIVAGKRPLGLPVLELNDATR